MAKTVLIEEYHLTVYVPGELPPTATDAVRRVLGSRQFRDRLRRAIVGVFRQDLTLASARVMVSR